MEQKLLIIGSTCVDVVIPLEHLPKTGDDLQPKSQTFTVGGCGWNACRGAILAGAKPVFLSPVGQGPYGQQVAEAFSQYGLDVLCRAEGENGCCYCLVEADGERTFMCVRGAEYVIRPQWLEALPDRYSLCYVCGMELQDEDTGHVILSWLEQHREIEPFYAPGPRGILIGAERQNRILDLGPIVHLNAGEITALTGNQDPAQGARALHERTGNLVIVTLGGDGCLAVTKTGELVTAPGVKTHVVDTIGAGDSHAGVMLAGLHAKQEIRKTMELANAVAAEVVSRLGADIPKTLDFMEEQKHGTV